jgi:Ribbon-helix-helix domain
MYQRLRVAPAPAPAPLPSWTGLYIGVHAGAVWQNLSSGSINDPNGFNASGPRTGGSALGGVGGLQAGYNWQFAPAWVAGVEGDISWTSLADQRGGLALGPISKGPHCELKQIAAARNIRVSKLISTIKSKRQRGSNLSSAIRLFILDYYQRPVRRRPIPSTRPGRR